MVLSNFLTELINASLNIYLSYLFFHSFWKNKSNPFVFAGFFIISDAMLTYSMLFLKGSLLSFVVLFVSTLLISIPFKSKWIHKIILSGILIALMCIIEMIVALVISSIFSIDFDVGKQGVLYVSGMLISKLVLLFAILIIRFQKHKPLAQKFSKNYWGLLIFPFASSAVILIQHGILIYNPDQPKSTFYFVLFGYTLLLLANLFIFDFVDSIYKNVTLSSKIDTANEIIKSQASRYQDLIDHNSKILKLQHDNKNFYIGILSELKDGHINDAIKHLSEHQEIYDENLPTHNNVIYLLVDIKHKEAQKKNVNIDFESHDLQDLRIPPIELAILLGNALDNAIEATEKCSNSRTISLFISINGNIAVISIKNPLSTEVDVTNLTSTKNDKEHHGFGIISMKQIAAKFGGEVIFTEENKQFVTSIILNNINPGSDE